MSGLTDYAMGSRVPAREEASKLRPTNVLAYQFSMIASKAGISHRFDFKGFFYWAASCMAHCSQKFKKEEIL